MINNLRDLSRVVNDATNYIVNSVCTATRSGQFDLRLPDVSLAIGLAYEDFQKYTSFILAELIERPEIIDAKPSETDPNVITVFCDPLFCPLYKWPEGQSPDSDSSFPISQPLDEYRIAELGRTFISIFLKENPERAVKILVEEFGASSNELLQLGVDKNHIFELEILEVSNIGYLEIELEEGAATEEPKDISLEDVSSVEDLIEQEVELKKHAEPYIQELEKNETTDESGEFDTHTLLNNEDEQVNSREMSSTSIQKAFDKAISNILENDWKYTSLKASNSPELEDYVKTYKDLVSMFLPRNNEKFVIQNRFPELYNGQACSIVEPIARGEDLVYKVSFNKSAFNNPEQGVEQCAVFHLEDLIPYKANDFVVGRWRIHLVLPGEFFGDHDSIVNNNDTLIEFWDLFPSTRSFKDKEPNPSSEYNINPERQGVIHKTHGFVSGREGWPKRRMASLHTRQGRFTGTRFLLSQILEGYSDYFSSYDERSVQGLFLSKEPDEVRVISPSEMCKVLSWLERRPPFKTSICEVKGEIEVPLTFLHEQDEIISYLTKNLGLVFGVSNLYFGQFGTSKTSTNVPFALQTPLRENSIEAIICMLLPDCEVSLSVSPLATTDAARFDKRPRA